MHSYLFKKPGGFKVLRRVIVSKCRVSTSRQYLSVKLPEQSSQSLIKSIRLFTLPIT